MPLSFSHYEGMCMRETGGRESRGQVNERHRGPQMQQVAFSFSHHHSRPGEPVSTVHVFYTLSRCDKVTIGKSNLSNLPLCILSKLFAFYFCRVILDNFAQSETSLFEIQLYVSVKYVLIGCHFVASYSLYFLHSEK